MLMEHWAHRLFELAPETLAVLSVDGQILQANGAWCRLVGWPPKRHGAAEGLGPVVRTQWGESGRQEGG